MKETLEMGQAPVRPMLSGHPALELLNTVSRVEGQLVDSITTGADVACWLAQVGHPLSPPVTSFRDSVLLDAARVLRVLIRSALELRKAGKQFDPAGLNHFLRRAQSHVKLVADKKKKLSLVREWALNTPEGALGPIAEAAADLLIGDLDLVRRCESSDCVLWFVDRTKSHHRRWCSTATCGNRHKVAAFRRRQQGGS